MGLNFNVQMLCPHLMINSTWRLTLFTQESAVALTIFFTCSCTAHLRAVLNQGQFLLCNWKKILWNNHKTKQLLNCLLVFHRIDDITCKNRKTASVYCHCLLNRNRAGTSGCNGSIEHCSSTSIFVPMCSPYSRVIALWSGAMLIWVNMVSWCQLPCYELLVPFN